MTFPNSIMVRFPLGLCLDAEMQVRVSRRWPDGSGWYDYERQCWVHELHHEDGRVERFLSKTLSIGMELFEDNP